jgi:hypothetical protein
MSSPQLEKLRFKALDVGGSNFITWTTQFQNHLRAQGLMKVIEPQTDNNRPNNNTTDMNSAKALVFILHHLSPELQHHYLAENDPAIAWRNRFDNKRNILRPSTVHEWNHLRLQDFKTVSEYGNALYRIVAVMKICGLETLVTDAELIEKTLSTFHPSNNVLAEQYRNRDYSNYDDLQSDFLLAEQNQQVLIKNHTLCVTGSSIPPSISPVTKPSELNLGEKNPVIHHTNSKPKGMGKGHRGEPMRGGKCRGYHGRFKKGQPKRNGEESAWSQKPLGQDM